MKSIISTICALFLIFAALDRTDAFSVAPLSKSTGAVSSSSLNMVFGKKKTAAQKAEEEAKAAMYWEGEWVCKDCGYIYNRVSQQETYVKKKCHETFCAWC